MPTTHIRCRATGLPPLFLLALCGALGAAEPVTGGSPAASSPAATNQPPTTRPVAAQPAATVAYEIALWPRLKWGVLSLTFDDGGEKHFTVTEPQLSQRGLRGTFFICTGWIGRKGYGTWDQVRAAAKNGHEIGSHTVSHGYAEGAEQSLKGSRDTIDREVPTQRCVSISYPSGGFNAKAEDYYLTGRMAGKHFFYPHHPVRLLHVEDYIMGAPKPAEMKELAEQAVAQRAWAVVTYHYPGDDFGAALDALKGYQDRLAIAPMGEVARYIREARAATLTLVSRDAAALTLTLADALPDAVLNQPLTLLIGLPDGWTGFRATQGGKPVWGEVREGRMAFEAVPDAGPLVLQKDPR